MQYTRSLPECNIQVHYQCIYRFITTRHSTPTGRTATVTKVRNFEMAYLIATEFLHTHKNVFNEDEVATKSFYNWLLCKLCKETIYHGEVITECLLVVAKEIHPGSSLVA